MNEKAQIPGGKLGRFLTSGVKEVGFSERIRTNVEAAPWVVDEVRRMDSEIHRLRMIEAAALNLVQQKGRHHTQQAYERLAALVLNA